MRYHSSEHDMLYQKTGVAKSLLAMDLISKNVGDRVQPVSEYEEEFQVSRGTVQNAFKYLKECGAIELEYHGHQGTYIAGMDYRKLQENCMYKELLGIMPLPYSLTYEGFATALYEQLEKLNFNMVYARGAVGRIELVTSGIYQFAICSRFAAEEAIQSGKEIEIAFDFGPGSFLTKHVLLFKDHTMNEITEGMRIAYDSNSIDQSSITDHITKGKGVTLVPIRTQQTITALLEGKIDAGVWNYDDIIENKHNKLHVVELHHSEYNQKFSTAVMVIKQGNSWLQALLNKYVNVKQAVDTIESVRSGKREPYY